MYMDRRRDDVVEWWYTGDADEDERESGRINERVGHGGREMNVIGERVG